MLDLKEDFAKGQLKATYSKLVELRTSNAHLFVRKIRLFKWSNGTRARTILLVKELFAQNNFGKEFFARKALSYSVLDDNEDLRDQVILVLNKSLKDAKIDDEAKKELKRLLDKCVPARMSKKEMQLFAETQTLQSELKGNQ